MARRISRWNSIKKIDEPYDVPEGWYVSVYESDMEKEINCVNCGRKIKFGEGYTSRRYMTEGGFGFSECEECYFRYKE